MSRFENIPKLVNETVGARLHNAERRVHFIKKLLAFLAQDRRVNEPSRWQRYFFNYGTISGE